MDDPLLYIGLVACAGLTALGLVLGAERSRLAALSAAIVLAPLLVVLDNSGSEQLDPFRDNPPLIAAAAIAAAAGLAIGGLALRRWPSLLVPALVATLPIRISVDLGGGDANLLLPLYAVIGCGVVASWLANGERAASGERRAFLGRGPVGWIGPALGAFVLVYALQAGYAEDLSPAVEDVGFFFAPFAAMLWLLGRARWDATLLRAVVAVLAVEGLVLALVAGYQYVAEDLFWNDKVIEGNEAHPYFRVNSLFWDPNILGRYLAVSMTVLAAVVAFARRRGEQLAAAGLFVVLAATLVVTFSQSSTIAVIAGMLVLVAARWGLLPGIAAGAATVLALAASLALIGGGGLSTESSGRSGLIDGGMEIFEDAPIAGEGSGSFAAEFAERFGGGEGFAVESHTEPVTVLAEQGAAGFAVYAGFLAVTTGALLLAAGPALRTRARGTPLAGALLAVYAVMLVHSLGYAAFFTDPITWAVLGIAAAALRPAPVREPVPAPAPG